MPYSGTLREVRPPRERHVLHLTLASFSLEMKVNSDRMRGDAGVHVRSPKVV